MDALKQRAVEYSVLSTQPLRAKILEVVSDVMFYTIDPWWTI